MYKNLVKITVGSRFNTQRSGWLVITKYESSTKIAVKFLTTGTVKITSADNIRRGNVKDHMYPSVFGVGYLGNGTHNKRSNEKCYLRWYAMLERCYALNNKYPTYQDCSVADIWHNFQNYAEWYETNYTHKFQIDKDILIKGNRVYSPEACFFVSHQDNTAHATAKSFIIVSPTGVEYSIRNLNQFCRENNLSATKLYLALRGDDVDTKGWKLLGHGQKL